MTALKALSAAPYGFSIGDIPRFDDLAVFRIAVVTFHSIASFILFILRLPFPCYYTKNQCSITIYSGYGLYLNPIYSAYAMQFVGINVVFLERI